MQETFQDTWTYTAKAVKDVNETFIIGAPGTCKMEWYDTFPQWAYQNKVPLDFFSTHVYPNEHGAAPTHDGYLKLLQQLEAAIKDLSPKMQIGNTAYGCTSMG
eukprot:37988_1